MILVLIASTTSYLLDGYSVRYLFQVCFCKFHLQRTNIVIQVLDLGCPFKNSRQMNSKKSQVKFSTCFDFLKGRWYKLASISIRIAGKIASHNSLGIIKRISIVVLIITSFKLPNAKESNSIRFS